MTTKITIDSQLAEDIYKPQFANVYEGYVISISNVNVVIDFNTIADAERFSLLENGVGIIVYDRTVLIDLHRFKDMAIEYLAGKGWEIIPYKDEVVIMLPIADPKSSGRPRMTLKIAEGFYPDKLSAELAAISFCWEQIQKEGKDEN